MKSIIFWDITPYSPLEVNRRAEENIASTCFYVGFLLGLFFDPEDGRDMFIRNVC
jgi:hypothetical protein